MSHTRNAIAFVLAATIEHPMRCPEDLEPTYRHDDDEPPEFDEDAAIRRDEREIERRDERDYEAWLNRGDK
jgi:hypothetical protein